MKKENNYPEILIPNKVYSIKKSFPQDEDKPKKPIKKNIEKPSEPIKPESIISTILLSILLVGIGFIISFASNIFGAIIIFGSLFNIVNRIINSSQIYDDYKKKYSDYKDKLSVYNDLTNSSSFEEKYNDELKIYYEELEKFEYESYNSISTKDIHQFRTLKLKTYFSQSALIEENDIYDYPKGISELYFKKYLEKEFKNVKTNFYINNYDLERKPFMPDFIICDEEYNFKIDIEIDEPYIGMDGTPIHINDFQRNNFFLENGFIVIRFSELQIVMFPKECCEVINETIEWIKNGFTEEFVIEKHKSLIHKKWTREEAHKMAFNRFRNTYLPKNLKEKIVTESLQFEKDYIENFNDELY